MDIVKISDISHAAEAADKIVKLANRTERTIGIDFNGALMVARPDDEVTVVFQNWDTALEANRIYQLNSADGRAKRRRELLAIIETTKQEIVKIDRGDWLELPSPQ